jgi:hypothetical protein
MGHEIPLSGADIIHQPRIKQLADPRESSPQNPCQGKENHSVNNLALGRVQRARAVQNSAQQDDILNAPHGRGIAVRQTSEGF